MNRNTGQFVPEQKFSEGGGSDRRAGFTLVELMVVVVLIAILAAVIIPEMKGSMNDALLRSTSQELVSVFNVAASRAISINQAQRVRLDHKTGKYVIEARAHEPGGAARFVPVKDLADGEGTLDQRIAFEILRPGETAAGGAQAEPEPGGSTAGPRPESDPADGEGITFYPDGTADGGDIVLRDREGFRVALRINPVTSRVRIIDLGRGAEALTQTEGVP
jgi:type II secretion system protein H